MVFEVENLNNASPATVSRCGQIFVSEKDLGFEPVIEGWIQQRNKDSALATKGSETSSKPSVDKLFNKDDANRVQGIFDKWFVKNKCIDVMDKLAVKNPTMEIAQILKATMTLNLLNGILLPFLTSKTFNKNFNEAEYEMIIIFSLLWGVAGAYEPKERSEFTEWLRDKGAPLPRLKEGESMFDYIINIDPSGTVEWKAIDPPIWKPPARLEFAQLLLPTIDSSKSQKMIDWISTQPRNTISNRSVLVIGSSGTAKTSSILMYSTKFDPTVMLLHRINFSSATQPHHFQAAIDSVCETKIRKGFGPKDGKKMTVFIDDFSMPEMNDWGDQITLEIVRELMEDSYFYRLEKNERGTSKYIENLQYIAAMGHPGGGRNDIPNRLKRQFFIFNMTLPSRVDLIFNPIL